MTIDKQMKKRIVMSLSGVLICGAAVGVFKLAAFGVDPFQTFMAGLDYVIPISFGLLYTLVNILLLSFSLIFDRTRIGIATFINLFLLGYVTQFVYALLQSLFPDPSLIVRIIAIILGIAIICFGSSLYMTADLGVSTYDAVAIVMANKWKWGKFKIIRICTDFICVALGVILLFIGGAPLSSIFAAAGVGTIITAFFMGPLIQYFSDKFAIPFLRK